MRTNAVAALAAALLASSGCRASPDGARGAARDTLVVFTAASLAAPVRAVLDTFAASRALVIQQENGASLELARRITALGRVPDIVALADVEVFPEQLVPRVTPWYAAFARNRMVVAYTDRSRYGNQVTARNWPAILTRPDVRVGRSDPSIAPVGYRALLAYALAERFYHEPGLAARLTRQTSPSEMRGNATELAALLSSGELDYIVDYESLAHSQHFRYVRLPPDIDLGDPSHAADYASVSVRVPQLTDTVVRHGAPILYALSIPRAAPHRAVAEEFLSFMLGSRGAQLLRANAIDVLAKPVVTGDSAPAMPVAAR